MVAQGWGTDIPFTTAGRAPSASNQRFTLRELAQIDAVPLVARDPGIGGDVGDGVVAGREVFVPLELAGP